MLHFVQYHNTEKMGYSYRHEGGPFKILTNKAVSGLVGNTIWLIAGEGKPRQYALASHFVVDKVGESDSAGFKNFASGHEGASFDPAIPINGLAWFDKILELTANFRFGLTQIDDGTAEDMQKLIMTPP